MAQPLAREAKTRQVVPPRMVAVRTALREPIWPLTLAGLVLLVVAAYLSVHWPHHGVLRSAGIALAVGLAYVIGMNGVSQTVATLVGGDVADYKRALGWGAFWTLVGSVAAFWIAAALVHTVATAFISPSVHLGEAIMAAVLAGTMLWILIATRTGMPVAATHAIAGAFMVGGLVVFGVHAVRWSSAVEKVVVPIVLSPILAAAGALALSFVLTWTVCHGPKQMLDGLHWISSGASSFARGINETPKIAALALLLLFGSGHRGGAPLWMFGLVGVSLAAGSFIAGRRVTKTLAERLTDMDEGEALAANATAASLVAVASAFGLPVSNAEVSSAGITGAGMRRGVSRVNWGIVREMLLAWVITAPCAGLLTVGVYYLLRLTGAH